MSDRVTVEIGNHVAEVTLNRPQKHNAVDLAMIEALIEAGESLADDTSVRAVVIYGAVIAPVLLLVCTIGYPQHLGSKSRAKYDSCYYT